MTLNDTVNNWSTEIESFAINFVHISGKDNVLVDTLSSLIDIDPDAVQKPELHDHEFSKWCFKTLPKARGSAVHQKIASEGFDICEIQITYDNDENSDFLLNYHWMMTNLYLCRSGTQKFENCEIKFLMDNMMNSIM